VRVTVPSGRFGTSEEEIDGAVFLVSRRAYWITGECIAVDGAERQRMR